MQPIESLRAVEVMLADGKLRVAADELANSSADEMAQ